MTLNFFLKNFVKPGSGRSHTKSYSPTFAGIMSISDTVTQWIALLKEGDDAGVEQLWQRYFHQLCQYARNKLPGFVRREFDEEDVALSAIETLYRGIQQGKYPRLHDRNNLWSLLVVITGRKVFHRLRDRKVQKRGGEFNPISDAGRSNLDVIHTIIGNEPTPEFACEVAEQAEKLLAMIPTESTRNVAEMKMAGYTNEEIALRLDCGKRTVERKLMLIRRIWSEGSTGEAMDH